MVLLPGTLVGKMSSWKMMKFLISSFTKFWYWTWSLWSGTGTSVGPKQMARLYGSIMFSSLFKNNSAFSKAYQIIIFTCISFWSTNHFSLFFQDIKDYLNSERWLRKAKRYRMTTKIGRGHVFTMSRTLTTNSCFDSNSEKSKCSSAIKAGFRSIQQPWTYKVSHMKNSRFSQQRYIM